MYLVSDLVHVMKELFQRGVDAVVIGGTSVELAIKAQRLSGDLDLFPLNMSPLIEEDFYRALAEELGWGFGYTDLGTPRLVARVKSGDLPVEFYENIHDFYIPPAILESATTKRISGVDVKVIQPEDYVVLKARAGGEEDLERLREISKLAARGKLKLNPRLIKRSLEYFPEDERSVIERRLKECSFKV